MFYVFRLDIRVILKFSERRAFYNKEERRASRLALFVKEPVFCSVDKPIEGCLESYQENATLIVRFILIWQCAELQFLCPFL